MTDLKKDLEQTADHIFFVVGCPRSGTSLMQYILSMHSEVSIPPETWFFAIAKRFFSHSFDFSSDAKFERVLERFTKDRRYQAFDFDVQQFECYARKSERTWPGLFTAFGTAWREFHQTTRFGEKSPENYQHMLQIAEWYPKAKFIYMMRDPRATVLSHSKRLNVMKNVYRPLKMWIRGEEHYQRALAVLGPERLHSVRYEDLVSNPEPLVREVSTFLDLEFEAPMLEPHKRKKDGFLPEQLPFMENTQKPIFTQSVRAWETELTAKQIGIIEFWVGRTRLEAYGYDVVAPQVFAITLQSICSRMRYVLSEAFRLPLRTIRKKCFKVWSAEQSKA